jgi:hypothetical protein
VIATGAQISVISINFMTTGTIAVVGSSVKIRHGSTFVSNKLATGLMGKEELNSELRRHDKINLKSLTL